ncbi:MAG: F0F1 ATP synthase subunit epsilon [Mogibacterium sp.]|nr:F0F1 ATP synthase subunit epsilon [Mogibacterium sp.]
MADNTFRLQIMASDHLVYDGEALSVVLPTTEGSVGIMAHHANIIMAVTPGLLEYVPAGEGVGAASDDRKDSVKGGRCSVVVSNGLLKFENNELMVLVDTAEDPDSIDEARAERAEARAREELRRSHSMREHAMTEAELSRAMSRIKASKNKHRL